MSKRVGLTRKQAEAMDALLLKYSVEEVLIAIVNGRRLENFDALNGLTLAESIKAMFRGYEVEQTPEDTVREYYKKCQTNWLQADVDGQAGQVEYLNGQSLGIKSTLTLLGIKIEGVNA